MNFLKALFGGAEANPEEEKREKEAKNFDLLKYDGVKAARMGQFAYAVKCYQKALELREDLEVRDYLAQALLRQGELEAAQEQYRVLAEAEPGNVRLWLQSAHVSYMQEDYAGMAEACERALALDAGSTLAHYQRAQAHLGMQQQAEAIAQLTAAIEADEHNGDAYLLRGQTLLGMGNVAGADQDATHLLETVGEQEDVLMLKARVEQAQGHADAALALYDKVVELNPFLTEAYRERGTMRRAQGDETGAQEDEARVAELEPQQTADVSGDYSPGGVEQQVKQAYSNVNPLGI